MKEITCEALNENAFQMIGKDWLLLTAKKDGKVNTMTASWGGVGVMWGKQVAFLFIRPQRYTKEFVDATAEMSISVLPEVYRKELNYFGTVSGSKIRTGYRRGKRGSVFCGRKTLVYLQETVCAAVRGGLFYRQEQY